MEKVSIIGLDLAKSITQVHAASADGSVLFRRKISSKKLLAFISGADSDEAAPLFRDNCAPGFRDDLAPLRLGSCWS